ncbi:MAG: oxidoreductase [Actinobacteria bacterium]|nr:oxidoreductase [Actinomycetota bacterium]|tara:strand:- start:8937 stop:9650 length:714 start_codon:yes stop_codon:yes gene_type:complete
MQALVTGGAQGIGYQVVDSLINEGYSVTVFDLNSEILKTAKRTLGCRVFEVDVSVELEVKEAISELDELDVLVNNAGIWKPELLDVLDVETQKSVWETNVIGTLNCTKHALRKLKNSTASSVINLTSAASRTNSPGLGMYAASKAAIEALTRQWSLELAPIRVNAVGPGMIITEGTAPNYEGKALEIRANAVPLKRIGNTKDIAQAVSFLASPDSSYITGQVIFVDGGITAGAPGHN